MIRIASSRVSAGFDPRVGHLPDLSIDGVQVLHVAPWREEHASQGDDGIPMVDRHLGGTFVCAPFGRDDIDGGPPHGQSANGAWRVLRASDRSFVARCKLGRGRITAQLALRDDHPVLYQTHLLDLTAPCTFAHHPMFRLAAGGTISTSRTLGVHSFSAPTAEGTALYGPDQITLEDTLETADGPRPWRDYPTAICDDFLAVVLAPGLAWTALRRHAEGDTILLLKRAEQLPLTCLWLSNGARQAAPWNGRHRGVIGIEDAICAGADGFAAALSRQSALARHGVPLALPAGRHLIPHALVRLPCAVDVKEVSFDGGLRVVTSDTELHIPFAPEHFS